MQQQDQESQSSNSGWQGIGKSDGASDAGDDTSSIKSGSTITNMPLQSQDASNSNSLIQSSSSNAWSATLPGMDTNPWNNSNSPAPSLGSMGWSNNPSSLSLSTSQGQLTSTGHSSGSVIGSSSVFSSTSSSSGAWSSSMPGNLVTSTMPPNLSSALQSNPSTQWQGNSMLGNIGDFSKTPDSGWNTPASSANDNKENTNSGDPRLWGSSDKPDGVWGGINLPDSGLEPSLDDGAGSELSFAQATLKGLKMPPASAPPQVPPNSRQEAFLRAIENHEGWGSRPIRQDTSWDVDSSPKTHRKFTPENNSNSSNMWINPNGTAIWEAVRENENSNRSGVIGSWSSEKDQPNWGAGPKPMQDPTAWNSGNEAKSYSSWGAENASGDASTNKMWGQKVEVGSWGEGVQRPSNIGSWGDDGDGGWDDPRRAAASSMGGMQNMVPPSPAMGAPGGMPGMMPQGMNMPAMSTETPPWGDKQGWNSGNMVPMSRPKMDEPWSKPPPPHAGWGDPSQDGGKVDDGTSIWAANSNKQLPPQVKPGGWGDAVPPNQWNAAPGAKPKGPSGWDEASWAMAQRAKMPPKYLGSGGNPPQMRSKLIQQLMDQGYRKEEAQNALITNNMNLEMALNDLKSNGGGMMRKDMNMDVFQSNGTQSRMPYMSKGHGPDDMSDFNSDQISGFKTMQNAQFPNASMQNQPFMQSNTSLPPSSLTQNNSILQQKLMQKMQQPQAPFDLGMASRNQMSPNVTNNSVSSEEVMVSLRQAVENGYISPQLLNYALPRSMLVLLQRLLQLQSSFQNALKQQQLAQQMRAAGKRTNHMDNTSNIANLHQQLMIVQKQIQQEQNTLFSQKPAGGSGSQPGMVGSHMGQQPVNNMVDNVEALSSDFSSVSLQSQSRLTTQWKQDGMTLGTNAEDKTDPSKMLPSSSSPNLNLIPGGLGMTGDRTWSSVPSTSGPSNWPMSSAEGSNAPNDSKAINSSSTLSDVIPEFVPGKPWQGFTKNVEDDPHVTPGSIQMHRSLSVNRVHDESLNNLDGQKQAVGSSWSSANSKMENSLGLSQLGSRPPPSMTSGKPVLGGQQWQSNPPINRQSSWAGRSGNSAFTQVGGSIWNDNRQSNSNWIILKNLSPAVASSTLQVMCNQYGSMANFYHMAQHQLALVQYSSRESAFNAVQRLNNLRVGNTILTAEFISEADARFTAQMPPPQPNMAPHMSASPWSQAPPSGPMQTSGRMTDPWGNSVFGGSQPFSKLGAGGDIWDMADHNSNLNNILGSETM